MEIDLPRITVITPSFNQGEYLEQTILSVLSQAYPNLEYIIIDGGSTDNSIEIIKNIVTSCHIGIAKRQWPIKRYKYWFSKSTGDILCWLNSDDIFFLVYLQKSHLILSILTNLRLYMAIHCIIH